MSYADALSRLKPGAPNPWMPTLLAAGPAWRWIAANLATVAAYFALAAIVDAFFSAYGLFPAPIWLPASIGAVAAMAGGWRMLPGIFLGSFLANAVLFAPPVHISLIISVTNALGPVIGAGLLRRLRPAAGVFNSFGGVVAFLLTLTFLHPAISASGGALALAIGEPFDAAKLYATWVNWWLTDSGGTLYLAPSLVLWLGLERQAGEEDSAPVFGRAQRGVWIAVAASSSFLFLTPALHMGFIRAALPFLLVVPLSWIALRMSLRSAYTLVTLVAVVATVGTVAGFGPFQHLESVNPLQLVGTLVALLAMNVLTIVALVGERDSARLADSAKSMFLAKTSHELRTPLNAIIGFSSMIDGQTVGPIDNPRYTEYARLIHTSGEHLLTLINGLMELAKIEAGKFELKEARIPLRAAIDEAVSLVQTQAQQKGVALGIDPACRDLAVRVDPNAFRQILLNLLSNALKFTPAGGSVRIAAARHRDGGLLLRVTDTGVGIAPEALARVFVPFERARTEATRDIEGSGLGLSITRGLVSLHGGTVTLASAPGQGTVATVALPAIRVFETGVPPARMVAAE